jgi:transcriptional regulator with XRE-family HTH domain
MGSIAKNVRHGARKFILLSSCRLSCYQMKQKDAGNPLAAFIRSRRLQADPAAAGFATGRRRTPGMRREELAQLAGISVTWVTWIEQGRASSVSTPTLLGLASALKMTAAERDYLFRIAGRSDPAPPRADDGDRRVLQQLVDRIADPCYVLDRYWDAVVWNSAARRLFPAWLGARAARESRRVNLLRYVFLDPAALRQVVDWKQRSQRLVAEFRADSAALRRDPLRKSLVDELSVASASFSAAWRSEAVRGREGGERRFRRDGRIRSFEQVTLRAATHPELKVVVLLALMR